MGKTADAVGTAGDKITKAFNSWRTPKPAAKPATTTATTPAKPAAATPVSTTAANTANAAGAAGGGGSAPCTPAKKELASGGTSGGVDKEAKPGTPNTPATVTAPTAPIVVETPPTFTAMPDGDVMLGYAAPGASATTYAKVKLLPAATPPPATSPHDGTYTDGKMFYTVSSGKLFVMPVGGGAGAGATAVAKAAPVSGQVADVSGSTLIINVGTNAGVKVGTTLNVVRPRVIKDPTTHQDLKTVDTSLGTLTITSADATSATGSYKGTAPTKVGDTVKAPD
jgi:hypothetical protein